MAIVKMKKLRVVAMAGQRETLMKGLLHLGCVEISEPDGKLSDPAWAALLRREDISQEDLQKISDLVSQRTT